MLQPWSQCRDLLANPHTSMRCGLPQQSPRLHRYSCGMLFRDVKLISWNSGDLGISRMCLYRDFQRNVCGRPAGCKQNLTGGDEQSGRVLTCVRPFQASLRGPRGRRDGTRRGEGQARRFSNLVAHRFSCSAIARVNDLALDGRWPCRTPAALCAPTLFLVLRRKSS
ncbi:hypothetical protein DEV91_12915 [Phyllobacterium brassicacearum]|nr:hypothetical protein DEV91_12915 [Phyllobacterium brassicacearum]